MELPKGKREEVKKMTDTKRLKELIDGRNLNISKVAKSLGISSSNLSDKINGRKEFRADDIKKIIALFDLKDSEMRSIFFN